MLKVIFFLRRIYFESNCKKKSRYNSIENYIKGNIESKTEQKQKIVFNSFI